ncbi:MAG: hypothetical protein LBH97_01810 [Treponema sp.]|jgi:hypothetical protein|nr:hypothetical protein [Treponema sp.]
MKAFGYSVFTGIAVLLVVLIVSCKDDADSGPFFDKYGNPLVTVAIQAEDEQGRALSADISEAIFNFYEVVVRDDYGGDIIYSRAAGSRGAHLFIRIRQGLDLATPVTGGAPRAVIFAGYRRRSALAFDNILLAIGRCTAVNGNTANLTIQPNTSTITFTMIALENDVIGPTDFLITGPTGFRTVEDDNYQVIATDIGVLPYFRLPSDSTNITARLHITGITKAPFLSPNPARSIWVGPKGNFHNTQFLWGGDPIKLEAWIEGAADPNGLLDLAQLTNGFPIGISTEPEHPGIWTDGWALLALGLPVKILADEPSHLTWYICTGMFHDRPDTGKAKLSLGGGILVMVGNPYHIPDF